jgi:hypothetical protein
MKSLCLRRENYNIRAVLDGQSYDPNPSRLQDGQRDDEPIVID